MQVRNDVTGAALDRAGIPLARHRAVDRTGRRAPESPAVEVVVIHERIVQRIVLHSRLLPVQRIDLPCTRDCIGLVQEWVTETTTALLRQAHRALGVPLTG